MALKEIDNGLLSPYVIGMTNQQAALSDVFFALSDATRRAVVRRLSKGPASISELARPFPMALPSFMQHIDVLTETGMIRSKKVGRVRTCELTPQKMKIADGWIAEHLLLCDARPETLEEYLAAAARIKKK